MTDELVCEVCAELDKDVYTRICIKCPRRFCVHNSSDLDCLYCNKCMTDIQLTVKEIEARKAREIKLEGSDLFFADYAIRNTPEHLIDLKIELYGHIYHGLLLERQEQKIRRQANLPKVKLTNKPTLSNDNKSKAKKVAKTADPLAALRLAMTLQMGKAPTDAEVMAFILQHGGIKN